MTFLAGAKMAKRQVLEIVCDRCDRKENQEIPKVEAKAEPELNLVFGDQQIRYEDLCRKCRDAVKNMVEKLGKLDRKSNS